MVEEVVTTESANSITSAAEAAGESIIKQTSTFVNWVKGFLTWDNLFKLIGALLIIFALWVIYKLVLKALKTSL